MFSAIPPITRALLVANVAVFLAQAFADTYLVVWFALWPFHTAAAPGAASAGIAGFLPWQILTYSFLHGNGFHLFFNMLGLFMFGSEVERMLGSRHMLTYYFVSVLAAGAAQLAMSVFNPGPPYPTVGASGGVFGLLLAYGIFFPRRIVMLIFPPIPMPARMFVVFYAAIELYLGVTGTQAGVAHFAHLGGMLGGWLLLRHWRRRHDAARRVDS